MALAVRRRHSSSSQKTPRPTLTRPHTCGSDPEGHTPGFALTAPWSPPWGAWGEAVSRGMVDGLSMLCPRAGVYFVTALCAVALLMLQAPSAFAELVAYSSADRATVRIIAVKGTELLSKQGRGENIPYAVADAAHGTGVLVSADGLVITARHVITNANHIVVSKFDDPTRYLARVLAQDPANDVAVLGIAGRHKDFLILSERARPLMTRQTVFTIGYPIDIDRGDPQSSRGIIAGAHPSGFLQLNVSINPGNSGGPVLDEQDHLLGIAVATRKNAEGIAYVVPARAINQLISRLDATRRRSLHEYATNRLPSDRVLGQLVVAFAEQADLLEVISDGIDRDHLSTMRALVEIILGEHHDSPDVLALVAGYLWNEALVLRDRSDAEWQSRMLRSVALCGNARNLDPQIVLRSPFVRKVLDLYQGSHPFPIASVSTSRPAANHTGSSSGFKLPLPARSASEAGDPEPTNPLLDELGPYKIDAQLDEVKSLCRRAGSALLREGVEYRCANTNATSDQAVFEFRICLKKVCRISMRQRLADDKSSIWLGNLGKLKAQYERKYGPAQRDVRLPEHCQDRLVSCLANGSARLEYRWAVRGRTVSITLGRHGSIPEMVVSLSNTP